MINPLFISDQLLFSTVRIEATRADDMKDIGTGFFFNFALGDKFVPTIVTNRHVILDDTVSWTVYLHEAVTIDGTASPSNQSFPITMKHVATNWFHHPHGLDLCALPIQPLLIEVSKQLGKKVFYRSLSEDFIPSDQALRELGAIEDIVMVGYPIGLWDQFNNMPLIRHGITASHPALDFGGKAEGLIDAACFPGSSGSPILIFNAGTYSPRPGAIVMSPRALLIGVLYGGPHFTAEGNIVVRDIPMRAARVAQTEIPANLGFYIKVREILVLGDELKKHIPAAQI